MLFQRILRLSETSPYRIKSPLGLPLLAAAFCIFIFPGAVDAQVSESGTDGGTLEEVIVTARRFDESLQDAPVAITAMTADFLADQRIQQVTQVIEMTPGASFTLFNKGQVDISMRGISSSGEGAAHDSAVMTMVDDVTLGKDVLKNLEFYDVQQIEVLRGPQGTTFGRNASAGVVHIINAEPTQESTSWLEGTAGSNSLVELNGAINGGLGETTAGRLSIHYNSRDGYTNDLGTGGTLEDPENLGIRGQLLFQPTDALDLLFKAEYSKDDDGNNIRRSQDCTQPYLSAPFGDYTDPCDPWTTHSSEETDGPFYFKRDITTLSAKVAWDMTNALTLTSITAFIDANVDSRMDNFGTPVNVVWNISADDVQQFTQEFRLDNVASDSSVNWILGLYYLADDHERTDARDILTYDAGFTTFSNAVTNNQTTSLGVFGQLDFAMGDRTHLTIGGRYTNDEKDFDVFMESGGALGDLFVDPDETPVSESPSGSWSNFSGSISLSFEMTDSAMIYGLVSQGYKAGGFNGEPYTSEAALTPFDEETSLNFEVGAKMDLADDRLRLNLAIYDLTYDDLQVQGNLPSGTPIVENASGADVTGIELEATWLATENLTFLGSYSKLDGKLRGDIEGESVEGNRTSGSPEWTATFAALLDFPLSSGSTLGFRADYRGRSDIYATPNENRLRPGVEIFGAQASWDSANNHWRVVLWGRNLTEEAEIITVGPGAIVDQNPTGYGAPRTYGATVRYNF